MAVVVVQGEDMVRLSKNLLKFSLFAAAVAVVGHWGFVRLFDPRFEYRATERVRLMLERLRPGGDRQAAACLWSRGSLAIPQGDIFGAVDSLDEWTHGAGFETVSEYDILGATLESEPRPLEEPAVIVDVRINGKPHRMRVVQTEPIVWLR
jgi:hypothetical protein